MAECKYPGYRHMTGTERYNARMQRIWDQARILAKTRFNPTFPEEYDPPTLDDLKADAADRIISDGGVE